MGRPGGGAVPARPVRPRAATTLPVIRTGASGAIVLVPLLIAGQHLVRLGYFEKARGGSLGVRAQAKIVR